MPRDPRFVTASILVFALVALLGAASCDRAESDKLEVPAPELSGQTSLSGPEALLAVAPANLAAAVRDRYRLRPDRRLLEAMVEIRRLRTGGAPELVKAEFQDGRWRIFSGRDEVGVLSEFPGFEEATDLLVRWAVRLQPASTAPAAEAGDGVADLRSLERVLRAVDAAALLDVLSSLSGSHMDVQRDPAKIRLISASLAWLATLTVDHLEQADPLLSEAWAWLALERMSAPPARTADTEVLVARALGYQAAAARLSATLPEDNATRHYGQDDEARLGALCAGQPTDRPCHFLRLALLAERQQVERFRSAVHESPFRNERSLAILGLETQLADFDADVGPGRELAALAIQAVPSPDAATPLPSNPGLDESRVEASTRDFEAAVGQLASVSNGRPINSAAIQAAIRAAFYSGLFQEASFVIDRLASAPAAQQLAESITTPAAGTANELRRWIEVSGGVQGGSTDMPPVAELLRSARSIGAAPLFDLAIILASHMSSTDPLRRLPMPALFERLDTRPSHLVIAARVARRNLVSPWLFEKLVRAASEAAPHRSEELPAIAAELLEDTVRLRQIAEDPAMPSYAKVVALYGLSHLGKADDAFVRARYEAMAADPNEGPGPLVFFLESRSDFAGAVTALAAVVERGRHQGLGLVHLLTEKARLQLRMGNANGAYATIEPVLSSFKEETLLQGATIQLARNRAQDALELAQAALERYPDRSSETSGLIARARWQLNDFSTAAKELAASRNGIVEAWNSYLPEGFAESFATAPVEPVQRAFSELAAAGIAPHVLADVAIALGKKRGLEIALPLLEGLRDPAPEWRDYIRLAGYGLIVEKSGADAALAWLRKQIPERSHGFALHLYQMRKYELLLGLFANGEEGDGPGIVRVVKAASHLHLRETTGPRWDGLMAEIKAEPSDDFFARSTRYLVGLVDDAAIMQSIVDASSVANLGWLKGVKAASAGHFAEADGWFQVALESAQQQQPPHAWAWGIESDWLESERSLEILEKKGGSY